MWQKRFDDAHRYAIDCLFIHAYWDYEKRVKASVRASRSEGDAFVKTICSVILVLLLLVGASWGLATEPHEAGWSADLLNRILKAEPTKVETVAPAPSAEMALHTYRLMHLRVGEAGKSQNVLMILGKLLPPGSSINPDVPENSLHILTTSAAHQAIWDYLSAIDVAETAATPPPATIPNEVKAALTKLADAGDQSAKLTTALDTLKADVSREIAQIDARQRHQTVQLLGAGGAAAALLLGTGIWMLRRRQPKEQPASEERAIVLAPDQLTTALTPVHDKMRNDMLGMLNEVAIKLQAQHHEQQKLVREQQQQIEDARLALAEERRQFISEAGTMVVQAVERVDATTAKLAKQQDKVAELVEELQSTVRELDQTKDELRDKQVQLEQERSKIAALSILLEEGGAIGSPAPAFPDGSERGVPCSADDGRPVSTEPASIAPSFSSSCTTPNQGIATVSPDRAPSRPTPHFQFLPPDHPEI